MQSLKQPWKIQESAAMKPTEKLNLYSLKHSYTQIAQKKEQRNNKQKKQTENNKIVTPKSNHISNYIKY